LSEPPRLDSFTELGIALKEPIPKGDALLDWVADEQTQARITEALLVAGLGWEEIRRVYFDLTRSRWLPSVEQLQHTHQVAMAEPVASRKAPPAVDN
jgi:hypothetical protein